VKTSYSTGIFLALLDEEHIVRHCESLISKVWLKIISQSGIVKAELFSVGFAGTTRVTQCSCVSVYLQLQMSDCGSSVYQRKKNSISSYKRLPCLLLA